MQRVILRLMQPGWVAAYNRENEQRGDPWRYRLATPEEIKRDGGDLVGAGGEGDVICVQYIP